MTLSSTSFTIADSLTGCTPQDMLPPSICSTAMLVTWRSSHKKNMQLRKKWIVKWFDSFVTSIWCQLNWQFVYSVIQLCQVMAYFHPCDVAPPLPNHRCPEASNLPECRKLKKLDTTESRAAAALEMRKCRQAWERSNLELGHWHLGIIPTYATEYNTMSW